MYAVNVQLCVVKVNVVYVYGYVSSRARKTERNLILAIPVAMPLTMILMIMITMITGVLIRTVMITMPYPTQIVGLLS